MKDVKFTYNEILKSDFPNKNLIEAFKYVNIEEIMKTISFITRKTYFQSFLTTPIFQKNILKM